MIDNNIFKSIKNNKKSQNLLNNFSINKFSKLNIQVPKNTLPKNIFNLQKPKHNMFTLSKIIPNSKGASPKMQNMWKNFSSQKRDLLRLKYKDSDGDRIPNKFDCSPYNIMRQDSWKFPQGVQPYEEEPQQKVQLESYGTKEQEKPIPPVQIINDENNAISLGEYSDNIREQGENKFITTTLMNKAQKLQDLYETAETVYPLNYQGYQLWSKNIETTDLEGVDTEDNERLRINYEGQMQVEQDRVPQEYINMGYEHIRNNPQIYKNVNKNEAAREIAISLMNGEDPTYIDQEYGDMGTDTNIQDYRETERNELIDETNNYN